MRDDDDDVVGASVWHGDDDGDVELQHLRALDLDWKESATY